MVPAPASKIKPIGTPGSGLVLALLDADTGKKVRGTGILAETRA
jgi:hypothetical protein